jgi:hypothetical protein
MVALVFLAGPFVTSPDYLLRAFDGKLPLESAVADSLERPADEGRPAGFWLAHSYFRLPRAPEVLVFGSSQLAGMRAADARICGRELDFVLDFRGYALEKELIPHWSLFDSARVFVVQMPGTLISDYFVIARALLEKNVPRLAVITLSPRDFMDNGMPYIGSSYSFQFFAPYVEQGDLREIAYPTQSNRWMLLSRLVGARCEPAVSLLANLCEPVLSPVSQAKAQALNAVRSVLPPRRKPGPEPRMACLRPGDIVFHPDDPQKYSGKEISYKKELCTFDSKDFVHQMRFFDQLLHDLQERGVKTVVVEMPLTQENHGRLSAEYWKQFHSTVSSHCMQYQAKCIDLSDAKNFNHDDFLDEIHMSLAGGDKLAKTIGTELKQQNILTNSVAVTSLEALR